MDERYRYLMKISRNLDLYKRKHSNGNYSNNFIVALHAIRHNEGMSQEELTKVLNIDKALTSRLVKKLINEGLVTKKASSKDKRCFELYATAKANDYKLATTRLEDDYFKMLYTVLSPEERELFLSLLTTLYVKSKEMRHNDEL